MSLLKDMIDESAAAGSTPAHAIAHVPGSLFGGGDVSGTALNLKVPKKFQKRSNSGKMLRRIMGMNESRNLTLTRVINLTEGWLVYEALGASSGETDFSASDVISKLDNAEKKAKAGDDTTAFGMEDEDGNLVKVYVKAESAEDFEKALASMLAGEDENEDDANSALEIAEVLFKLKDKFEIVDVEWPEIEGDEEEEQEIEGGEEGMDDMGGAEGEGDELGLDAEGTPEGDDALDMDGEGDGMEEPVDDEADAKSALDKVIDMMKADADAKMAEAKAREAEAKAKEAEHTAKAAQARVTQEEQVLDMETYYKDKQDQEKETKQLAKMAKFRHDQARDAETNLSMESVEEKKDNDPYRYNDNEIEDDERITHEELATLILKNLRHN